MPIDWSLAVQPQTTLKSVLAGLETGQKLGQQQRSRSALSALLQNPTDPVAQRNALAIDPDGAASALKGWSSLRDIAQENALDAAYNQNWNPETGSVDRRGLANSLAAGGNARAAADAQLDLAKLDEQARKADSASLKAAADRMDFIGQLAGGVVDQASWEDALNTAAENNIDVSNYSRQYDPAVVARIREQSLTGKERFDYELRLRGEQRQERATEDLIGHRAAIRDQGERRLGMTADHYAETERQGRTRIDQGERRLEREPQRNTIERVLSKVEAGEPLTEGEVRVLEYQKSGVGQRGGGRGGFRYTGPRAGVDAAPAPAPAAAQTRSRPTPPRQGGQTSGGRYRLPAGYTPQRFVQEARDAVARGADRAAVQKRLTDAGFPASALGR